EASSRQVAPTHENRWAHLSGIRRAPRFSNDRSPPIMPALLVEATESKEMKPMCLMIVDDNPEMRRLMRRTLASVASEIVECEDGIEAFEAYARWRPDWVLMDIELERGDGITATRQIKAAFPEARVIIVTSHGDEPLRAAASEAGACGYVLKENLF